MPNFKKLIIIAFLFSFLSESMSKEAGKISLSVPKLSEEEIESNHIPYHMKCDACMAVAYQIQEAFWKKELSKKSLLKESDVIDILEHVCYKGFDEYGVKQVEKINRLTGPGLETAHVMGMTQMGGRWPHRLQEMCHYYVGEAGEMDIYNTFHEGQLSKYLCYGKGIYSHCVQPKKPIKSDL
ncbi:hypothetical protein JTE90_024438 [Oedothorax gibbosus]|uniref:Uncharacterized protein n=1 Tax=Oedothorax gibbosus TaxID=931172 RepID=A0AAV6UG38_9ARAC|nr:hypothetical protein JTE90_024438 [Oedothorax gibbosus]